MKIQSGWMQSPVQAARSKHDGNDVVLAIFSVMRERKRMNAWTCVCVHVFVCSSSDQNF